MSNTSLSEFIQASAKLMLADRPQLWESYEEAVKDITMAFSDVSSLDEDDEEEGTFVEEAFEILRTYIQSTHLHDNNKGRDSHFWPGAGNIDWKEAMELLRSAPNTPPLLLEIEADEKINPLDKLSQTFDKLEAS